MKRILYMIFKNLIRIPGFYVQLWWYARHSDSISEEKKYALLKKIVRCANEGGNVRIQCSGKEHIPDQESFMFFPNHQGMYDVLAIIDTSPYFFSVVVKQELLKISFLRMVFKIMGCYAIDRDDVRQSMKVIQNVSKDVSEGRNFLIFAEGTRSKHGNSIGELKGGSFKSAMKARCPIVPVAIIDSYQCFDTNSIRPVTVQVHYLEPIRYEEYKMMKTVEVAAMVGERIKKTIDKYTSN